MRWPWWCSSQQTTAASWVHGYNGTHLAGVRLMLQVSIRVPGKEQKLYKEYMMKVLRDAALARAAGDVVSHVPGRAVVLRAAFGSLCCAVGIGSMPQQARASRGTSAVERSAVFF
jgi:hypothetical protein